MLSLACLRVMCVKKKKNIKVLLSGDGLCYSLTILLEGELCLGGGGGGRGDRFYSGMLWRFSSCTY